MIHSLVQSCSTYPGSTYCQISKDYLNGESDELAVMISCTAIFSRLFAMLWILIWAGLFQVGYTTLWSDLIVNWGISESFLLLLGIVAFALAQTPADCVPLKKNVKSKEFCVCVWGGGGAVSPQLF